MKKKKFLTKSGIQYPTRFNRVPEIRVPGLTGSDPE